MQELKNFNNIFNNPPSERTLSKVLYFLGFFSIVLGTASIIFPFLNIEDKIPFKIVPFFPYLLFALLTTSGILCLISSKMLKESNPKGPAIGFAGTLIFDFSFMFLAILDVMLKDPSDQNHMFFFFMLGTHIILNFPTAFLLIILKKLSVSVNSLNDEMME